MHKLLKPNSNYSILLLIATVSFLVLGIISNVPATKISFYSISAFLISFTLYKLTNTISRGSLTLRMIVLSPTLQFVYISIFFLVGGSTIIYANYLHIDIGESPFRTIYSLLVVPFSALVGAFLFKIISKRNDSFNYKIRPTVYNRLFEGLLIIAAFYLIYYRIGLMRLPIISSGLSFVYLGLTLTPFLIGYFSHQYKLATKVFIAVYLISTLIAFGEGSRGHIFFPPVLFFLGYIQNVQFKKRITLTVIALFILPIILIISGGISEVRKSIRSNLANTTITSNIVDMAKNAIQYSGYDYNSALKVGIGRMIVWSNLAVTAMSPGSIPYRGFSDIVEEIEARLKFTFLTPDAAEDEVGWKYGLGAANNYGFVVSIGSTVPFPVFADTWSRGGFIYTSIIVITMCLIFGYIEKTVIVVLSDKHYIQLFIVTILSSVAYETFSVYSLIYTIKFLFLSVIVWAFILKIYIYTFNILNLKQIKA